MPEQPKPEEFAKPTFRAVNESYLLFGLIDWRYGAIAVLPALFMGSASHSRLIGVLAVFFWQWIAYRIYSRDAAAPLIWAKTLFDKSHSCPFTE